MNEHLLAAQVPCKKRSLMGLLAFLAYCLSGDAAAGIATDSSLGHPAQSLTGPNYLIPQSLGLLSGSNLFQSFQTFSLNTGESANFTTATPGINNVISRVTGGTLSQINGQISLTPCTGCGSPNFVFINPAGITFGAGASVNVPGAFHISTADYVKFPDGSFYADQFRTSTLSIATPEAFGFLGTSRASITVNGGATLKTQTGQSMTIAAGDVTFDNGVASTMNGGDIRVLAVGQTPLEVGFTGPLPPSFGNLNILNGGNINTDTSSIAAAGSIYVGAGNISIDGNGFINSNGITTLGISSTTSTPGNIGNAGNVNVIATGNISLTNGGVISGDTYSSGNAGSVNVSAGIIAVDASLPSGGPIYGSRISSQSNPDSTGYFGSTGNAGNIYITATGSIIVKSGGSIDSDTNTLGNAGSITVNAANITLDGQGNTGFKGISSDAYSSIGKAGDINIITSGKLSVLNGGNISADTNGSGNAGNITITANSINVDGQGNGNVFTGIWSEADGGTGNAGNVLLTSGSDFSILNGGEISAVTNTPGSAGSVNVTATGNLFIANGGKISTSTTSTGNAGLATIIVGSMNIDGQGNGNVFTGIGSSADFIQGTNPDSNTGNAGTIAIKAIGVVSIVNGGLISADTHTVGNAGFINATAGSISLDGQGYNGITGISSDVLHGNGSGGSVSVNAIGNIAITNGALVTASTFATGNAGTVAANAGSISIDGQGNTGAFTGFFSTAFSGSTGSAGALNIAAAGNLSLINGGEVSANTLSLGNAGAINIAAGSITVDGKGNNNVSTGLFGDSFHGSEGNAGSINVTSPGNVSLVDAGQFSTTTSSSGNAGLISVNANSINIDGQGHSGASTGILSDAFSGSSGNAGTLNVTTRNLSIFNGGVISSNTASLGDAGSIIINSGSIGIDGAGSAVSAAASAVSSGQTGKIAVTASNDIILSNNGQISIANGATVVDQSLLAPTSISVTAPTITILNSPSAITTKSAGNVDAGDLNIVAGNGLFLNASGIYTSANMGNGGSIDISAGLIRLDSSQISAVSIEGFGGNINLIANALIMNTGYILAYAPTSLEGGNININVPNLIASGGTLFTGLAVIPFQPGVFGLNVIQATGTVHTSAPALDIVGGLIGLKANMIDSGGLGKNPCLITGGSSLSQTGQGGLPPSARGLLRAEPLVQLTGFGNTSVSTDSELRVALLDWRCN